MTNTEMELLEIIKEGVKEQDQKNNIVGYKLYLNGFRTAMRFVKNKMKQPPSEEFVREIESVLINISNIVKERWSDET